MEISERTTAFFQEMEKVVDPHRQFYKVRLDDNMAWRHGVSLNNISGMLSKTNEFEFDPSLIFCPVLNICSNGEYLNPASRAMEEYFMQALSNPNKKMSFV
jgi:hypothetical protein